MQHLTYKCRLCGGTFTTKSIGGVNVGTLQVVYLIHPEMYIEPISKLGGAMPKLLEVHSCGDGSVGVADLQGAKYEKLD